MRKMPVSVVNDVLRTSRIEILLYTVILISDREVIAKISRVMRKPVFAHAKTKKQISCAVTAQLISVLGFATWIVQFVYHLNPKFQASSPFL